MLSWLLPYFPFSKETVRHLAFLLPYISLSFTLLSLFTLSPKKFLKLKSMTDGTSSGVSTVYGVTAPAVHNLHLPLGIGVLPGVVALVDVFYFNT